MRLTCGWRCWWGVAGALAVAAIGAVCWVVATKPESSQDRTETEAQTSQTNSETRISRNFPSAGVKKVILRGGSSDTAEIIAAPGAEVIDVSGIPAGGAKGYHTSNPNWRDTPAAEWGMDFASTRLGDVLVISTRNEIRYIHHSYQLQSIVLRVPEGVEVALERRKLTGDGAPDLSHPKP